MSRESFQTITCLTTLTCIRLDVSSMYMLRWGIFIATLRQTYARNFVDDFCSAYIPTCIGSWMNGMICNACIFKMYLQRLGIEMQSASLRCLPLQKKKLAIYQVDHIMLASGPDRMQYNCCKLNRRITAGLYRLNESDHECKPLEHVLSCIGKYLILCVLDYI